MDFDIRKSEEAGEPVVFRDDERVPWVYSPQGVRAAEEGFAQPIDVIDQVYDLRDQLGVGMLCRGWGRRRVSARSRGELGLAKANIDLPISHKSWLVHGDQAEDPTERLRIRYPVWMSCLSLRWNCDGCDYKPTCSTALIKARSLRATAWRGFRG